MFHPSATRRAPTAHAGVSSSFWPCLAEGVLSSGSRQRASGSPRGLVARRRRTTRARGAGRPPCARPRTRRSSSRATLPEVETRSRVRPPSHLVSAAGAASAPVRRRDAAVHRQPRHLLPDGRSDLRLPLSPRGVERGDGVPPKGVRLRARPGGGGVAPRRAGGGVHGPGVAPPLLRQAIHDQVRRRARRRHDGIPRVQARGMPSTTTRGHQRLPPHVLPTPRRPARTPPPSRPGVRGHQARSHPHRETRAPRVRLLHPRRTPAQVRPQLPPHVRTRKGRHAARVELRQRFPPHEPLRSIPSGCRRRRVRAPRRQNRKRRAPGRSPVVVPLPSHRGRTARDEREYPGAVRDAPARGWETGHLRRRGGDGSWRGVRDGCGAGGAEGGAGAEGRRFARARG